MDTFIHYGLAASIQAVRDAGLPTGDAARAKSRPQRIGCLVGSGIGGLPLIEDTHAELTKRGPRRITPFFVPASIINMISGHVSIMFGFQGPNLAIVTACTTGLHSIGDGRPHDRVRRCRRDDRRRRRGDASRRSASAASPRRGRCRPATTIPTTASRPWDKDRDGFVLGEGAGVLVLEEYEHAKRARRQDLRRAGRLRHERRRLPHDRAERRRPEALDAGGAAQRRRQRRPGRSTSTRTAPPRRSATSTRPTRSSSPSATTPRSWSSTRPSR